MKKALTRLGTFHVALHVGVALLGVLAASACTIVVEDHRCHAADCHRPRSDQAMDDDAPPRAAEQELEAALPRVSAIERELLLLRQAVSEVDAASVYYQSLADQSRRLHWLWMESAPDPNADYVEHIRDLRLTLAARRSTSNPSPPDFMRQLDEELQDLVQFEKASTNESRRMQAVGVTVQVQGANGSPASGQRVFLRRWSWEDERQEELASLPLAEDGSYLIAPGGWYFQAVDNGRRSNWQWRKIGPGAYPGPNRLRYQLIQIEAAQ